MEEKKVWLEVPRFTGENVPVNVAARVMKKDPQFVRQGIIQGLLTFGVAFKKDGSSQYDYYLNASSTSSQASAVGQPFSLNISASFSAGTFR